MVLCIICSAHCVLWSLLHCSLCYPSYTLTLQSSCQKLASAQPFLIHLSRKTFDPFDQFFTAQLRISSPWCSYSTNREDEQFVHETKGFTSNTSHVKGRKPAVGWLEITCLNVEADTRAAANQRQYRRQFQDMEYRWSTLGFSLWLSNPHGRRPRRVAIALTCHPEGYTVQYTAIISQ